MRERFEVCCTHKMAGIVDHMTHQMSNSSELVRLLDNPMFGELQATLASDVTQTAIPYLLVQADSPPGGAAGAGSVKSVKEPIDLIVEDAALQAEFRQLAPLTDPKVTELEKFYQTQSASVVTQRSDAIGKLQGMTISADQLQRELQGVNEYYDQQQAHLTVRISQSLQLVKHALPPEAVPSAGAKKKQKTRMLGSKAVEVMNDWYQCHVDHPYPTDDEKAWMADIGNITLAQVKAWFANKRNRTLNTRPKRQKHNLQKQLNLLCSQLAVDSMATAGGSGRADYTLLMEELSDVATVSNHNHVTMEPTPFLATPGYTLQDFQLGGR